MKTEFLESQLELAYPDGIENHYWHLARNRIIAKEIGRLIKPGSTILDIGCGRGVAVKYLRSKGVNCIGVEPAQGRPLIGISEYIHFEQRAEELPAAERDRCDIILLLDVIEHIADPITFLRALTQAFPNAAYFVITVPARPELWSNYDEFYGHHRRYTIEMIENLAKQLHWHIMWRSYFFRLLYLPARMLAMLGKQRSVQIKAPQRILKWIHYLTSHIIMFEYYVFPAALPGTSIIACFSLLRNSKSSSTRWRNCRQAG